MTRPSVFKWAILVATIGVSIVAWKQIIALFSFFLSWSLTIFFLVAGAVLGAWNALATGRKHDTHAKMTSSSAARLFFTKIMEEQKAFKAKERKIVNSRNLDLCMQELMDLILRDYVMAWYQDLGRDDARFKYILETEVWHMIEQFSKRVAAIDHVELLANDIVNALCTHFRNIRLANAKVTPESQRQEFVLHPWLTSKERELEFLRKTAEIFVVYLCPTANVECEPVKYLLREILASCVFQPAIDLICDPDYTNQKLYGWLEYKEQIASLHKRTYLYAASYEDFFKLISETQNIEQLQHLRYSIISEIMQAATIQNLKRAKGIDVNKESVPQGTTKGHLLKARNLKRYINQLTVAKASCERQIQLLGGPNFKSVSEDSRRLDHQNIKGQTVYSFRVVMENAEVQNCLLRYLHKDDKDALLRFWIAVESMRQASERHTHVMASEVYQMFIAHPSSIVRLNLERSLIKNMENFMLGNMGPDAFYKAQEQIYHMLEEQYYPSFILSDIYHRYIAGTSDETLVAPIGSGIPLPRKASVSRTPEKEEPPTPIAEHSTYAAQKLRRLDERILNKMQALQALEQAQKADNKIRKLQRDIELEIETLKTERRHLEFHLDRTEVWAEHVCKWKAHIYATEIVQEDDKKVPYFVVVCHLPSCQTQHRPSQGYTQGWVVSRTLQDFHDLHQRLLQIDAGLRNYDLPTLGMRLFQSLDEKFLDRSKVKLEKYLTYVLRHDHLAQSEAVFIFFSPSPEYLKETPKPEKKKLFSFGNIFKKSSSAGDSESEDELIFDESMKDDGQRDSIATPFYFLLGELFESRGMFKWLRRTLVVFVKVTYGSSINRQLRETVAWIVSEPMLIYYLTQFRDAYWPNGNLAEAAPPRSDEEKLLMRRLAKEKILHNIPDAVKNLFGETNSRQGTIKLFETLQDTRLNKQLFYDLLEPFLYKAFPELQGFRETANPTSAAKVDETPVYIRPIMPMQL